ncbi:MAG: hypothetical protein EOO67_04795 [Microbacterium sp.]|nr:MAG: hypothetical protein EOO67_04795 [Microbacterium sp.]
MGLFQHRPEEPTEWGGLPSEPLEPAGPADLLPEGGALDAAAVAAPLLDIPLLGDIPRRETISIIGVPAESPHHAETPLADASPDGDGD